MRTFEFETLIGEFSDQALLSQGRVIDVLLDLRSAFDDETTQGLVDHYLAEWRFLSAVSAEDMIAALREIELSTTPGLAPVAEAAGS